MNDDVPDSLPRQDARPSSLIGVMIAFELGLAVLAISLGWMFGYRPLDRLNVQWNAATARDLVLGCAACLPMILGLLVMDRYPIRPFRELKGLVDERLVPLFAEARIWQLLLISAAAGLGEELLFRGLVQGGLSDWLGGRQGQVVAVAVASLVFGVCHWLSNMYLLLATAMGFYFAFLLISTGNLLTPIVTHGLYDFFALVYLLRPGFTGSTDQ